MILNGWKYVQLEIHKEGREKSVEKYLENNYWKIPKFDKRLKLVN